MFRSIFGRSAACAAIALFLAMGVSHAQSVEDSLLPDNDTMLLTVFLKHDQSMNNVERGELLQEAGFNEAFPPEGVEIVDHYVMLGIGQVIVMRFAPNMLRFVNRIIENTAWGAFQTEFYATYDLREARLAAEARRAAGADE